MYRAVALAGMRQGVDWEQPEELAELAETLDMRVDRRAHVSGRRGRDRRGPRPGSDGRYPLCRRQCPRPRKLVHSSGPSPAGRIVTEGRDQGTVVFPDAACKIFLTASEQERAWRRF